MAIPNWLQVTPKEGSNNKEITLVATAHTGRNDRSGTVVGTTSKNASASLPVTQTGHAVYITLKTGETAKSCTMSANTVTIEGTSNSPVLKIASTSTVISGVTATLAVNSDGSSTYAAIADWNGITNTSVPETYGKDAEYYFKITFSIPENQTLAARKHIFSLSNGDKITSEQATITQNAGYYTYSDIVISSFSYGTAYAAGETVSPSLSYTQSYGWNGRTSGAGTVSSGATLTFSEPGVLADSMKVDKTTGKYAVESKGTQFSNVTTVTTVEVKVEMNGKTKTATAPIKQEANYIISIGLYMDSDNPLKYNEIGAGDTYAMPTEPKLQQPMISFSSGGVTGDIPDAAYGTMSISKKYILTEVQNGFTGVDSATGKLTATARGTEIGPARESASVRYDCTYTWTPSSEYSSAGTVVSTIGDNTGFSATCTQKANYVESVNALSTNFSYPTTVPASGSDSVDPKVTPVCQFRYASGSTSYSAPDSKYGTFNSTLVYSGKALNGFSVPDAKTGKMTCASRGTVVGDARTSSDINCTYTVEFEATGEYDFTGKGKISNSIVNTAHATQEANSVTYGDVVPSGDYSAANDDIPASGGTRASIKAATASQIKTYTSGSSLSCSVTAAWGKAVSADTLGTTAKSRSKVGTITVTWSGEGSKSATKTYEVYQAANAITNYGDVTVMQTTPVALAADGQDYILSTKISQNIGYTSGALRVLEAPASVKVAVKTASTGFTLNEELHMISVGVNPGVTERGTFVVTLTCTGEGSKTGARDISFTQHASTSYINFSPNTITFDAAGGTKTVTLNSNDSWTIA